MSYQNFSGLADGDVVHNGGLTQKLLALFKPMCARKAKTRTSTTRPNFRVHLILSSSESAPVVSKRGEVLQVVERLVAFAAEEPTSFLVYLICHQASRTVATLDLTLFFPQAWFQFFKFKIWLLLLSHDKRKCHCIHTE